MQHTSLRIVRDYNDDSDARDGQVASATLPAEVVVLKFTKPSSGPRCTKCEHPLPSKVVSHCNNCGWHPRLNIHTDIDPECESALGEQPPEPISELNHLQLWINLIERWGWIIVGSIFTVILTSLAVRWFIAAVL